MTYSFLVVITPSWGLKNESEKVTLFVIKEHKSKFVFTTVVPRKGVSETTVAVDYFLDCAAELGYSNTTIYLMNDQEPALKAVIDGVILVRSAPTLIQESPVGSSQSNGSAENSVSISERGVRKLRIALETRYKCRLPLDMSSYLG